MKKSYILTICLFLLATALFSDRSSSLNISFSVPEVQMITINDQSLHFNLNYAGHSGQLYEPRNVTTTYNITSTSTGNPKRLLARLNQNMPSNVFLEVRAEAPTNANSLGYVTLTTGNQALVTGISNVHETGRLMQFRLKADLGAQVALNQNRTVTFTISD